MLDYVEMMKQELCGLLSRLTIVRQSKMIVPQKEYSLAEALIREAIDELYYSQTLRARQCKEAYERGEWLKLNFMYSEID